MSFEKIIGNDNSKKLLTKCINTNNLLHSYMFIGPEGIGKSIFAKEFAKMILCTDEDVKPCNKCKSCIEFESNNNPDFFQIESDGKIIKIDQIRQMEEKVIEKPMNSGKKVYIINDADLMTKEAQNCLLKTLEEPPEYIVIILIVANESKILTTIKSRCMKVIFNKLDDNAIEKYMKENCNIAQITNNVLKMCDGSIGKATNLIDKLELYNQIEVIIEKVNSCNQLEFMKNAEIIYKSKDDIKQVLEYINVVLYNMALNSKKTCFINAIKVVEKTKIKLIANSNYDMSIDDLLLKIWEEVNEKHNRS